MRKIKRYLFRGKMLTVREICGITGYNKNTIFNRIRSGKQDEELAAPILSKKEAGRMGGKMSQNQTLIEKERNKEPDIYQEIATELGISRSYVYKIEKRAMDKFKRILERKNLCLENLIE